MKQKKLSKEMINCLAKIQTEEILIRTPGGFWTGRETQFKDLPTDDTWVPVWYFGKGTIQALLDRGLLIVWNSRPGKYGVYPYEVKIAPDYKEKIKLYNYEK